MHESGTKSRVEGMVFMANNLAGEAARSRRSVRRAGYGVADLDGALGRSSGLPLCRAIRLAETRYAKVPVLKTVSIRFETAGDPI